MAIEGLTTVASSFGPKETMDRFAAAATAKGLTVFARIDHAAGAAAVGLPLRATELLVLGNAKGGTPLMQAAQTIGIDLGEPGLAGGILIDQRLQRYNDPAWLARRHGLGQEVEPAVKAMAAALAALATAATAP